ncbi:hypothetical protein BC748_1147 [Flavobacterium dankookense]|uniref:Uncharacterized protein n=1 Tax=Flavobacterium dankookense TaxID=706186 RepID=A0A4R6QC19_9FLAO|nr:hypothetical protein BC748_1147 [Flavobacterium dankookense]
MNNISNKLKLSITLFIIRLLVVLLMPNITLRLNKVSKEFI